MINEKDLIGKVPDECIGCTKERMDAINCRLIGQVPEKYLWFVHCGKLYSQTNGQDTASVSGWRFLGGERGVRMNARQASAKKR